MTADLLALACTVAREAGELLAGQRGRPTVVSTKSSPTDVVTEMDQASELLIRARISAERPQDTVLGEEGGETGSGSPVRWVVDPLDGTVNFLYGLPDWAVSIAAEVDGQIVAGAVYAPRRDVMFGAELGRGAWRTGPPWAAREAIACNDGVRLSRALIATGFGYEQGRRLVQGQVLSAVLPKVRDIRRNGAAAIDLCMLASGQVDGYYERGLNYWDIAAGGLIAREAGAIVGGLAGTPAGPSMTIAAGRSLFADLHDLLLSTDPERDA